ncbi:FmdB family zinc ribbon protein [Calorimonas adulescens]|uniref:Zinc ribbon domain-containing protein n=1 Tax=Calorimonas adulescens TaxID=2606906 RepID=A0A5D8Q9A7_9THEO|nr:zinc ribbon domain-containing protein [Calorimonas adulescens]TZE80764.1 zinc ribbon domain-containing protein [Calorimonas adulescens]
MPSYDFICKDCRHYFSDMVSIKEKDEGNVRCPSCGSNNISQVFKSFNFIKRNGSAGSCSGSCSGCSGCSS